MRSTTRRLGRVGAAMAALALALSVSAPAGGAAAASPDSGVSAPGPMTITRVGQVQRGALIAPGTLDTAPPAGEGPTSAATPVSDIVLSLSPDVPPEAAAAFEAAALMWETVLESPIPIVVAVDWLPLGAGILGSAGPTQIFRDFAGADLPASWYPVALVNAQAGVDVNGPVPEISMRFSSTINWHLDPDAPLPDGAFDLATVAAHEMGHGLGFIGSAQVARIDGLDVGRLGIGGFPLVYDRFVTTGTGTPLLSLPDGPDLAAALQSNDLVWSGPSATEAFGEPPRLFAPASFQPGSSYSHFDEATYPAGDPNALMTPALSRPEIIRDVGSGTAALLEDIGWSVAVEMLCQGLVPTIIGAGAINGTAAADVILGSDGPDTILGFGGDDVICGLGGDDVIRGFAGDDTIDAGPGDDDATGGNGNDTILGGPGIDKVKGDGDDDIVDGGDGDDRVIGGPGADQLFGGPGADVLRGENGDDALDGGDGDDILAGNNDDDVLVGGPGADEFRGGPGIDVADYSGAPTAVVVKLNSLADDGAVGEGDFVDLGVENVTGSLFDDRLIGSSGDNVLRGLDGDDTLLGRSGNDTTDGGFGTDICNGNGGTDVAIDCESVLNAA